MKKKFTMADFLILGIVAILGVLIVLWMVFHAASVGDRVLVEVDGQEYGTYDLKKDAVYDIKVKGEVTNTLTIKDGKAYMSAANCPDHLCMKQGKIHQDKQTICCLPNKVVVTVISNEKNEYDSVVK
ncbi:MAG: NusG domain II-containing protein [Lachnospiraceae bacterium]|nr:NusG domain II-containing protein [Lachnospiraceae bacterium]